MVKLESEFSAWLAYTDRSLQAGQQVFTAGEVVSCDPEPATGLPKAVCFRTLARLPKAVCSHTPGDKDCTCQHLASRLAKDSHSS